MWESCPTTPGLVQFLIDALDVVIPQSEPDKIRIQRGTAEGVALRVTRVHHRDLASASPEHPDPEVTAAMWPAVGTHELTMGEERNVLTAVADQNRSKNRIGEVAGVLKSLRDRVTLGPEHPPYMRPCGGRRRATDRRTRQGELHRRGSSRLSTRTRPGACSRQQDRDQARAGTNDGVIIYCAHAIAR
jgi:hypothetical protein